MSYSSTCCEEIFPEIFIILVHLVKTLEVYVEVPGYFSVLNFCYFHSFFAPFIKEVNLWASFVYHFLLPECASPTVKLNHA